MKLFSIKSVLIFCFSIALFAQDIELSDKEKDFIDKNPIVKIAMMPDFTPFTYYIKNTPVGFEHDLLKLISLKSGLIFEKKIDKWTNIYNSFKNQEVDMITSISYKKYREPFTTFTSSYYDIPIMIFVRDNFGEYKGLKSLQNKKVGVLKDVFYVKELEKLETMKLVYYDNYAELTKDLVFGKIDALIQNLTNINYLIKENLYTNLTLASELILPNTTKEDLRFGIQPNNPLLSSIIQKALNSIDKKEKEALVDKWIGSIKEYKGGHIELEKDEIAYLDTHIIKYCINPDGLPFEGLDEKGEHTGMSSDYYNLFEKMISGKFEFIKTKNWNQSINYIKQHKCDMLALGMETNERKKYLNFTSSYLEVPLVVATRINVPFINNILDLEGEKIGIIKGDAFVKILRQKYPSLDIVEVEGIKEGLDKVKDEKLFAYIDTLASIGYEFQQNYFGELKIAGKISENLKLSIAVNKEDKVLINILQKAVNNITNEMHREIFSKWIPIKYQKGIDYQLVWAISIVAILFILLVVYWNRTIIKTNDLLKNAQKEIESKNKELKKLSITDGLTKIYNRRKLDELLENEFNRCQRFQHTFAVVMLDIDHFKKVNDTFGHQAGDIVLIEISKILKHSIRKTDYVGRFGGEEFIIISPETNQENIYKLIEKIRFDIENHHFKNIGKVTASFGISMLQEKDTVSSLLQKADEALYKVKNSGRNKVLIYSEDK